MGPSLGDLVITLWLTCARAGVLQVGNVFFLPHRPMRDDGGIPVEASPSDGHHSPRRMLAQEARKGLAEAQARAHARRTGAPERAAA